MSVDRGGYGKGDAMSSAQPVPHSSSTNVHSFRFYSQRTEAYIRYIDRIARNCPTMCDWRRELSSSRDLFPDVVSPNDLLNGQDDVVMASWLDAVQGGAEKEEEEESNSIDSLFALRDFMLQEALSVVKFA